MAKIQFHREYCTACGGCVLACMDEKDTDFLMSEALRTVRSAEKITENGVRFVFESSACLHCTIPACMAACSRECFTRDAQLDLVLLNADTCNGCGACAKACRAGAIRFRKDGSADKCDGCYERQKAGLLPACVKNCPSGALTLE